MERSGQNALAVLMVRPASFGYNPETAASNAFQKQDDQKSADEIQARALAEFDGVVTQLCSRGVRVVVADDTPEPAKSDAVFPNNWLTTHDDGTVVTFPMFAVSRRQEVRVEILDQLGRQYRITSQWRLDQQAPAGEYLEGTGSIVLDRQNRIAYACESPRTSRELLHVFCRKMLYSPIFFGARDGRGLPLYHTNVMMSVLARHVVICLEAITASADRSRIIDAIEACGQSIIDVSQAQLEKFACNLLQIGRQDDRPLIALSTTAYHALSSAQRQTLSRDSELLPLDIPAIEHFGGGSVRCMLAEIFLPPH
jgi:hypothetical protein